MKVEIPEILSAIHALCIKAPPEPIRLAVMLSLSTHILHWFRTLGLRRDLDLPFLLDTRQEPRVALFLAESDSSFRIFIGVYDIQRRTITHHRYYHAASLDAKTLELLRTKGPLVFLL